MNDLIFKAVLAMDSYNRGYNAGLVFSGVNKVSENYNIDSKRTIMMGQFPLRTR